MPRFIFTSALAVFALAGILRGVPAAAQQQDDVLSEAQVLRDPDIPVAGNPKGDITIVEYFDYQCPYCRQIHPDLLQVVEQDQHVRLVFKDWPIFGGVSIYAAKLILAAKFQNKYIEAHNAVMGVKLRLTEAVVRERMMAAGVDVERAVTDLADNEAAIGAILARNDEQAKAFGFDGTPSFIIGKFRIPGVLDAKNLKQAIQDARARFKQ